MNLSVDDVVVVLDLGVLVGTCWRETESLCQSPGEGQQQPSQAVLLTEFGVEGDGAVAVADRVPLTSTVAASDLGTAFVGWTVALLDLPVGLTDHTERIATLEVVVVEVATLVARDAGHWCRGRGSCGAARGNKIRNRCCHA